MPLRRKKASFATGTVYLQKDPRVYAARVPATPLGHKRVLGIDLGTNCGVVFADFVPGRARDPNLPINLVMGQWDLSLSSYDSGPLRHIRLKQFLEIAQPDLIMFEDVKFTGGNDQFAGKTYTAIVARVATAAELLGGFKITLATWAEEHGVPAHGLGIGEIKKYATGKGNANKADMIMAANEKFGTNFETEGYESTGVDNICDAAFCCDMGLTLYSEGL